MSAQLRPLRFNHEQHGVLPQSFAENLRDLWLATDFEQVMQGEIGQYETRFRTDDPSFPAADEIYSARFKMNRKLHENVLVQKAYQDYIYPHIRDALGIVSGTAELICYRMDEGDYFRAHKDDYAGRAGFVYYLSKRWVWDWGGVLMAKRDGVMTATLPQWNMLTLLDHRVGSPPHFVSPVMPWAQEPRLMLVGLLK